MLPVDDEKFSLQSSFSERITKNIAKSEAVKGNHKKTMSADALKDDSFIDGINWNEITSNNVFFKGRSFALFSPKRWASSKSQRERFPEQQSPRSKTASNPATMPSKGSCDTNHHYPMTKITETLYLGNDHDASDEAALKKAKITHVLSMIARKWSYKPRGLFNWMSKGIQRKCVPMKDDGNSDVAKLLEEKGMWNFILDSQKKKNKLLVHCQMGMNRSPTIVMGFLMKHDHITFYKAWRLVKQKRVIVQPHVKYIKQLRSWNMYLHGSYSTPSNFLEMKVSEEVISVLHENADTKRMNDVMVESTKMLQDKSTLNMPVNWDSLDIGSPRDEMFSSMGDVNNMTETYITDSEDGSIILKQNSSVITLD